MAIKLKRTNEYADRPLLTEKEIKFLRQTLTDMVYTADDTEILGWSIIAKLARCERRINKLKYN